MRVTGKYSWLKHLDFMVIDMLCLAISFSVCYRLKFGNNLWQAESSWGLLLIFLCLLDAVLTFLTKPYSGILRKSFNEDVVNGFLLAVYNMVSAYCVFYLLKVGILFSREVLLTTYVMYFFLGLLLKQLRKRAVRKRQKKIAIYVVSEQGKEKEVVRNALAEDYSMYEVVGCADHDGFLPDLLEKKAREILIAVNPAALKKETYEQLLANGIGIHMNMEAVTGFQTENQVISRVGIYRTLSIGMYTFTPRQLVYLWIKRVFDIFCGCAGLVILIPLSAVIKVISLCNGDTAGIFYRQTRVGQNGETFRLLKFRSMVPDADRVLAELLKEERYRKEWEEDQKFKNDPRVTKLGNFLRKTSLDELPQLLNVIRGEMSLVGPRPLVPGELEAHEGLKLYNQVKPGITGWWGCNGRSNIDYRERLELEYYYVRHCSLYLDVLCILKTVLAVLKREGSR